MTAELAPDYNTLTDEAAEYLSLEELEKDIEAFFNRPMPIDVREERLAQRLLDKPHESLPWLVGFEDFLTGLPQYALMADSDPLRANRFMRHIRKIPFQALSILVFNRVLAAILPSLESNQPLCPQPDKRPYFLTFEKEIQHENIPFTGNAAAFLRCLRSMLHQGWDEVLAQITDPADEFYPVWECFQVAHGAQMAVRRKLLLLKELSAEEQCYLIAEDNAFVALELLTNLRAEYAEECAEYGDQPSAYGATYKAIRSADELGWPSSGNVSSIGRVIGTERLALQFPEIEVCPHHDLAKGFADRKRLVVPSLHNPRFYGYNHISLADGPWEIERFCPATSWLQSKRPEDLAHMERFDKYLAQFSQPEGTQNPAYDPNLLLNVRSTLLVSIAALVACETIFKEWNRDQSVYTHYWLGESGTPNL